MVYLFFFFPFKTVTTAPVKAVLQYIYFKWNFNIQAYQIDEL